MRELAEIIASGVSLLVTFNRAIEGVIQNNQELRALDFFTSQGQTPAHVGVYVGNNQFPHAAGKAQHVIISDLNQAQFWPRGASWICLKTTGTRKERAEKRKAGYVMGLRLEPKMARLLDQYK